MQMRTADCAGDDLDDDVAAILDLGVRQRLASTVVLASGETNAGSKIDS